MHLSNIYSPTLITAPGSHSSGLLKGCDLTPLPSILASVMEVAAAAAALAWCSACCAFSSSYLAPVQKFFSVCCQLLYDRLRLLELLLELLHRALRLGLLVWPVLPLPASQDQAVIECLQTCWGCKRHGKLKTLSRLSCRCLQLAMTLVAPAGL